MKLLIFKPKPDESEKVLCDHLYIHRSSLKKARRVTSSLLIHDYEDYYITLNPYISIVDRWIVPNNSYSYKTLTVVTYED